MPKTQKAAKTRTFSFVVNDELGGWIDRQASSSSRSVSHMIAYLVRLGRLMHAVGITLEDEKSLRDDLAAIAYLRFEEDLRAQGHTVTSVKALWRKHHPKGPFPLGSLEREAQ
jgi:hypothetical protein